MIFFALILSVVPKSVNDKVFRDLEGHWDGRVIHTPSNNADEIIYDFNISVDFTLEDGSDHLTMTIANGSESTGRFFVKKVPDVPDHLLISDKFDEDIAEVSIKTGREDYYYVVRGILKPKNDQITISIEGSFLSVAITDQFSANVTLVQLNQESKNKQIANAVRIGMILTVIVCLCVAVYKASDLADVIPQDEGKNALAIKQMALAQERAKKKKEEQEKNAKAKSDSNGKAKTE